MKGILDGSRELAGEKDSFGRIWMVSDARGTEKKGSIPARFIRGPP